MRKIVILAILSIALQGCELTEMDPTEQILVDMDAKIEDLNNKIDEGIEVRVQYPTVPK
jgi:hypothetical protein